MFLHQETAACRCDCVLRKVKDPSERDMDLVAFQLEVLDKNVGSSFANVISNDVVEQPDNQMAGPRECKVWAPCACREQHR